MRLEYQILIAVALDLVLGDPRWLPHPVRGIGGLASRLEAVSRRWLGGTRTAGAFAALAIYAVAGGVTWIAIRASGDLDPLAGDVVSIVVIYTTIAAHDLAAHSMAVFRSLATGNLAEARRRQHRSRRYRAADGCCERRPGRRDRLPRDQYARFDVRPSGRTILPVRLGRGAHRRPGEFPSRAVYRSAGLCCGLSAATAARCLATHAVARRPKARQPECRMD